VVLLSEQLKETFLFGKKDSLCCFWVPALLTP